MSKRVRFSESETMDDEGPTCSKRSCKPNNSVDTGGDEDDEYDFDKNVNDGDPEILDIHEIKAQEAGEVAEEEGIRFTAFNLEEEMEEGHFDSTGNFIFKKEVEIKDNWLDNIDWVEIKKKEERVQQVNDQSDSDSDSLSSGEKVDRIALYKKIVVLLQPGESVQKAIRRFGGSNKRGQKSNKKNRSNVESANGEENVEKMTELIGYADELVNDGEMDIYQFTHEKLNYLIKMAAKDSYASIVSADKDGGDCDMFSDSFDVKKSSEPSASSTNGDGGKDSDEVLWEFRWKNDESEEIQGPYPTSQMIKWEKDSYFEDVYVRKVGSDRFYPSSRIDFDLYT